MVFNPNYSSSEFRANLSPGSGEAGVMLYFFAILVALQGWRDIKKLPTAATILPPVISF
jgi:hypothetical protein